MVKAWSRWLSWVGRSTDARVLAMVRIALASVTAGDLLWTWWLGLVPWLYRGAPEGMAEPSSGLMVPLELGPTVFWGALAAYVCVALGLFVRPAILVAVLLEAQLGLMLPAAEQGVDHIVRTAMLILLVSPCDARWAVGPSRRRDEVPGWSMDLLVWLVVLVYFGSGLAKPIADASAWLDPSAKPATMRIMADPLSGVVDPEWAWRWRPLFHVLDWATLLFEIGAPMLLTRWGRAWAAMGVVMHLGLFLSMNLGQFPFAMLAFYPLWFGAPLLAAWDARRAA